MSLFYWVIGAFLAGVSLRACVAVPFIAVVAVFLAGAGFAGARSLIARASARDSPYSAACFCLIALSLGAARAAVAPQTLPHSFAPVVDTKTSLTGTVAADPDVRETGVRVIVRVESNGQSTRVLAVLSSSASVAYGDTIRITGKFKKPQPFASDGGRSFRYDHYLMKDGVFGIMQPASAQILAPPHGITRAIGMLYTVKNAFARGLENALPEPEAGLAEGLITGGKQGLGAKLLDAFTTAGIVQIVVLSGYNVMIVAEAILQGLSWLPKRVAISGAALGIVAFVVAAGSGSSAVRAAFMACLALFAKASGRSYDVLRALTLTVALMAFWNPYTLAFDPSFQLSALATYGLILGVPVVEPWLGWMRNESVREAVATTLAAELAVLPLLLWQTGNFSLVSIPANVAVSFIVPGAMASSALAGAAGMVPHAVSMARLIALPAFGALWIIVHAAERVAALPFAQVELPAFSWVAVAAAYAFECYLVMLARAGTALRKPSN